MSLPSVKASMTTFLFLSLLTSFHSKISEAASVNRAYVCPKEPNFTPNSTYQSNLNHLLSSLSSNANLETGFYNTTVGHNPPNIVYGLFLCRGDVTPNVCQDCVSTATKDTVQHYCPTGIEATVWYDKCMLRYSNESFFSSMIDLPKYYSCNDSKITVLDRFDQILGTMINDSVTQATGAHDEPGATKFATKEASISSSIKLYSLVQCTPDISSYDCDKCLRGLIANIPFSCSGKQGAIALTPSCNFRYEVYQFYRILDTPPPRSGKSRISSLTIIAIVTPIAVSMVLLAMVYCLQRMSARKKSPMEEENESLLFDLATLKAATNKFSEDNKLGKGGFGEVYKGILSNGQEIAAKMLSKNSTQGAEEFKNEVAILAKLQHRNLVRLFGFCLEGEEKILVYEYVPNKSLDYFLNDPEKQRILNWSMRYKIIGGIARGILYLHEDSRLRIIHRDLKVSNILLDENMNPKISDFGLARIFGNDQTLENTHKIAGTYGYIPPEYAMYGQFSIKTDVFSFGILLLEILCGKKNTSFYTSDAAENLLSYAWKHWRGGTSLELLDPTIRDSYSEIEVNRCIHIALLCVQENPAERPTMDSIILMLNSDSVPMLSPQPPAVFLQSRAQTNMPESESDQSTRKSILLSVDEASITEVYPR
ncbi:cysteine-rich receptor-like protein kinase 10 [Quercus lobata]|uniref:non-specific serine/threonine protein kinase n=1 Tax=Quercus lobata TaxID=97700 RepID=A0A7N2LS48_QUELO|nr:cysteine-rich receptor-like protein kinase 10 [Quercus lobata]